MSPAATMVVNHRQVHTPPLKPVAAPAVNGGSHPNGARNPACYSANAKASTSNAHRPVLVTDLNASLRRHDGPNDIMANSYASPSPSPHRAATPTSAAEVPFVDLSLLQTEGRNAQTQNIDIASTEEMCGMINAQDQTVALSVQRCIPVIAQVIDALAPRVARGGRVVYVGAGTSGRLGILDASEIPPTFSAPYGQWIGLIAGGNTAIQYAVEGAEDKPELGQADLQALRPPLCELDSVIGLAASGRTPYVIGALDWARDAGAFTAGICCVKPSAMRGAADVVVECPVGPEVVTGSTRMKSGTAQKMILNMVSTGVQLKIGKTYGNLMVDVKRSNAKLIHRGRHIFRSVLEPFAAAGVCLPVDLDDDVAIDRFVDAAGGTLKVAMVAARWGCSASEASRRLDAVHGLLKKALEPEGEQRAVNGVNGINGVNLDAMTNSNADTVA